MEPVDEEEKLRGGATEARCRRSRSRRRRRSRSQRRRRKSRSRHGRRRRGRKSQAHIPRSVHIPYINLGRRWDGRQMDSRDANWRSRGVRSLIKPTDMLSSKKIATIKLQVHGRDSARMLWFVVGSGGDTVVIKISLQ